LVIGQFIFILSNSKFGNEIKGKRYDSYLLVEDFHFPDENFQDSENLIEIIESDSPVQIEPNPIQKRKVIVISTYMRSGMVTNMTHLCEILYESYYMTFKRVNICR